MTGSTTGSSPLTITLNEEERTQLVNFLEQALRDKRVEIHRTEASNYRERLSRQEAVLRGLLDKLRRP
jgi:nicotinamide riboside kinase